MSKLKLRGSREARNEQRKALSLILRTIGFGAIGVGLWEPLSTRSYEGLLLSLPLILISGVLFMLSLRQLAQLEEEPPRVD